MKNTQRIYIALLALIINGCNQIEEKPSEHYSFDKTVSTIFFISCFQQMNDANKLVSLLNEPIFGFTYKGKTQIPSNKNQFISADVWSIVRNGRSIDVLYDTSGKCTVLTKKVEDKEQFLSHFQKYFSEYIKSLNNDSFKIKDIKPYPDNGFVMTNEYLISRPEGQQNVMITVSTNPKNEVDAIISAY